MDDEKAAAYYQELVLKGEGAARFKQGLGYGGNPSWPDPGVTSRSIPTSMSNFVRQSSPRRADLLQKEIKVESIRDKLTKGEAEKTHRKRDEDVKNPSHRQRSWSPGQGRTKHGRQSDRGLLRRKGRISPGRSGVRRKYSRSRSRSTSRERSREPRKGHDDRRGKRKAVSPSKRRSSLSPARWKNYDGGHHRRDSGNSNDRDVSDRTYGKKSPGREERNTNVTSGKRILGVSDRRDLSSTKDYSALIPGYDDMTRAQKLKAKMRLQLSEAVVNDSAKGMTGEWERFDFDNTAPLDDDGPLPGSVDDTDFLKLTGSTFLTSSYEARREARIQEAHEAAIFGAPALSKAGSEMGTQAVDIHVDKPVNPFISEEVVKMQQQESWQERAKRLRDQRAAATTS